MFLRILNDEQKRALWVLAYQLVVSDHSVSKKEGKLLDELTNGLRTEIRVSPQQLVEKPSLAVFDSYEVKCAVMLEVLSLAYGDNLFPDAESKMVQKLAHDLGFSDSESEALKNWGKRSALLLDDALALMSKA